MTGYQAFINIFDHIKVKSWKDSPECFPLTHVRNAVPAPGWFQPQEKCLNRQQLAGFPLFPQRYQTNSDKIKIEFPTGFTPLISSFEAELDITESKTLREVECPCKFIWVKFGHNSALTRLSFGELAKSRLLMRKVSPEGMRSGTWSHWSPVKPH